MKLKSKLLYTLLAAIAVSVLPMKIQAQTGRSFTISSGQVKWLLGGQSGSLQIMSYRPDGSPDYGTYTGSDVTFQVDGGANYLALNPAGDGSLTVTNSFSDRCVWHNSDNPGYCYQEVEGYRYYLRGTVDGLSVWKVAVGQPIGTATKWTALEAGGYLDQSFVRNGQSVVARYWMMFDGSLPKMSCEAFHRPESRRFVAQTGNAYTYYCPNGTGTGSTGVAAVLLPVETIEHAASVPDAASQNIGVADISGTQTLKLGESFSPAVVYTPEAQAGANYNLIEAYREVRVCTKLKGLTLAGIGNEYVHGDHGIPTWTSYYYYSSDGYATRRTSTPTPVSTFISSASVNQWHWELDNASKRYLTISGENTASPTITCIATPAPNDVTATLTVSVTTTQGITESATVTFTVSSDFDRQTLTESENSVFINGAVFGGGRMADIDGSTDVLVINCDSVSRVYGGNDICGTVRDSAQVVIGNTATSDFLGINSVYGAGNGFYSYNGTSAPFTVCNTAIGVGTQVRNWGDNSGDIIATVDVPTNVPLIYKTKVFINSAYARIDTVFGGARNADVVLRPGIAASTVDTLASVTVNNGIVYAVFGGNNVGGCMNNDTLNHARSAVNINKTVLNPNLATDTAVVNSFYTRFGREYALRYVFGGGNKVFSALRSDVYVNGGMIDTCFAGGNMASVYRANVYVDCNDTNKIYHNGWVTDHDWDTEADMVDKWVGTRGNYNIRALFGGNNRAPMECVPDVLLTAGGIGVVYGGGSAGDMVNERLNIASDVTYVERHRNAITNAKNEFNEAKNRLVAPQAALGTFIHVPATSTDLWVDYLYGGCRSANVNHATLVHLEGGHIGTVFGGCNISGNVGWAKVQSATGRGRGGTYVVIDEGAKVYVDVFGGSNGYYHCVDNEQAAAAKYIADPQFTDNQGTPFDPFNDYVGFLRPTHNYTHLLMNGGEVYGNVYGGGNHATVGYFNSTYGYPDANAAGGFASGEASPKHGSVHLSLMKGTIHGNVFGGSNMSTVYGLSYFYIGNKADGEYVTVLGDVYGGNDRLGDVGNGVTLPFADASGTELTASDGTPLNDGGVANYNTYIYVQGTPQINRLFGGGNGAYNYGEQPEYGEPLEAFCTSTANHTTVPVLASAFIDINTDSTARIDTVFGGGNAADVQDHVKVLLNTTNHDINDTTVGVIFGGNNQASMNCVPEVKVQKGVVNTIFGGGNMGHMLATTDAILDQCGNTVPSVSSYVLLNSDEATVLGAVFGGCNKADVHGMAYVQVVNTSDHGVDTIYGGNDVSGRITGDTRVDIFGGNVGTVYGGSNGYYDYEEHGINDYRVRTFNHAQNTGEILYENSIGSPYVDETTVNIFGGYVKNNIYGGGRMGDCRLTNVIINDDVCTGTAGGGAILRGRVYGGGEGDTARLDIAHRGNVREATNVELHHASDIIAIAYGGGKGGDVHNANLTSFDTWDESFQRIFGGCWGSDVTGTARTTIDANMTILAGDESIYTAEQIFGGNDFTGNCFRSELILNSGRFDTVYGAGCGKYPATPYLTSTGTYTQNRDLYVPNNEEVVVTVNGSDPLDPSETTVWVNGILFGGGQMGTTMRYVKNSMGHYIDASNNEITSAAQAKVADTNLTVANAHTNANDYAYISVNVHGGQFAKDIFAGAQGEEGHSQLVYGLKMLNMDGGYVKQSIYGGSQSVSDGYSRQECNSDGANDGRIDVTTTMRPSSVLNLVGGTVENHVYGAGFKGFTYGSVYVNVGRDAVENSTVWRTPYGPAGNRTDAAYADFKPGVTDGIAPALTFGEPLMLIASVYAGANWGQNSGSYEFTGRGFYGGESRILIDGKDYSDDNVMMEIGNSILGAGTSVLGGDLLSRIDIRNYGGQFMCDAEQDLMAVQRADALYLHNTGIRYLGITDASSALYSPNYAINKVDTVNAVGYNIIEIEAPKAEISLLRFFEDVDDMTCYDYTTYPQAGNCLVPATLADLNGGTQVCTYGEDTACSKLNRIDPNNHKYTALLMNNGVTVDVHTEETGYGGIIGYGYLIAQDGTKPVVRARIKNNSTNPNDGGFSETCNSSNMGDDGSMQYRTYAADGYRYWAPGGGLSTREVVLLAHSNPTLLDEDKTIKVTSSDGEDEHNYSLAHTQIVLPPSKAGNYYKLGVSGIKISEENDVINLVDIAWRPSDWNAPQNDEWATHETQGSSASDWFIPGGNPASFVSEEAIQKDPNTTFGIFMACGEGFTTTRPNTENSSQVSQGMTVITSNPNADVKGDHRDSPRKGFYSYTVASNDVSPVMDLYLTYDNSFFNSVLGSVKFVLVEYGPSGQPTGDSILVEAYVSTIINEFKDMEFDLIATSNEGESNTFLRRGILPATLSTRSLYIESVKWFPTKPSPEKSIPYESGDPLGFTLSGHRENPGYILTNDPVANRYRFAVNVQPADNSSEGATSDIGWYSITNHSTDVYTLAKSDPATGNSVNKGNLASLLPVSAANVDTTDLTGGLDPRGVQVGILDGRGLAGLNFELFYDGRFVTEWRGYYVGDIVLGMNSYVQGCDGCAPNPFTITLHVKVRPGTDTIFVGTVDALDRARPDLPGSTWPYVENPPSMDEKGRRPKYWVKTLKDVEAIWKEGTVVCVVDEVIVDEDMTEGNSKLFGSTNAEEPMEIIRYTGHHSDKPNESGVYRGPMINVTGGGRVAFRNVIFKGSAVGMLGNTYASHWPANTPNLMTSKTSTEHLVADTNLVYGPILAITDGGYVSLENNVVFEENWNAYTGDNIKQRGGAISITDSRIYDAGGNEIVGDARSTLRLHNNVTVQNNIVVNNRETLNHSDNGAIYLDKANLQLGKSSLGTAIKIIDNHIDKVVSTGAKASSVKPETTYWTPQYDTNTPPALDKWIMDTAVINALPKGNVFLTRSAGDWDEDGVPDYALEDTWEDYSSAVRYYNEEPTAGTRIGISRWFPGDPSKGETPRDTIQIAYHEESGTNVSKGIYEKGTFSSDEGYKIMYSPMVDRNHIYEYRCATFRHQDIAVGDTDPLLSVWDDDLGDMRTIAVDDEALEYKIDPMATCPNGGDSLIYRVRNGFFPYTYRWFNNAATNPSHATLSSRNTETTNIAVMSDIESGNYSRFFDAVADTIVLPYVALPIDNTPQVLDYTVTATDAFGCQVSKRINITIKKDRDAGNAFAKTTTYGTSGTTLTAHWTDTNSYLNDPTVVAAGVRTYRGVVITPYAWPSHSTADASYDIITATGANAQYAHLQAGGVIDLATTSFCEGDVINLQAADNASSACDEYGRSSMGFIMWDFDPYVDQVYSPTSNYIVPPADATVMAYYGPINYWTDVIYDEASAGAKNDPNYYFTRTNNEGYITTYNDDVHIYNEAGLAWLISIANGLNLQQLRQFYFNQIYLHKKSDGTPYDMGCYKWTPIGNAQHPFRGWFIGVGSTYNDTARLANGDYVVIKNLVVDEPLMSNVGFFGHIDTARISGIKFEGALMRGAHHVGTLAARSTHARINNVAVVDSLERDVTTTLLVTHNISGGLIGYSENDIINRTSIKAKYLGDAVYSGGVVGYGNKSTIANSAARNDNRMNGLYLGGIAGYLNGDAPVSGLFRAKRAGNPSVLRNNYVRFTTHSSATQVGGLVGHAENTIMENNYVYGQVTSLFSDGGVASTLGNNANVSHNYYASAAADKAVGSTSGNANLSDYASFQGSGNAVTMSDRVDGVNNLTRVLNIWVREQNTNGGEYLTWTSDMVGDNHGYPVFGTPDLIPVYDSVVLENCGEVEWNGILYHEDTRLVVNFIDSVQMIDSTLATIIRVHHATYTQYADSATVGLEYSGYGFYVSVAESELLRRTLDSAGYATLVLTDTLQGVHGCDSIITLSLTFSGTKGVTDVKPVADIKVYPNPTTSVVNVATDEMSRIELYDNGGRTLQNHQLHGQPVFSLDLSVYPAGVYYIRVHTPHGVTIQKVIKR